MRKYIVMDFDKWDGGVECLVEGRKYYLTEDGKTFIDDHGGERRMIYWSGGIYEYGERIDNEHEYLYVVKCKAAFSSKRVYVFADSKKGAVSKALQVLHSHFDNLEIQPLTPSKDILYAD